MATFIKPAFPCLIHMIHCLNSVNALKLKNDFYFHVDEKAFVVLKIKNHRFYYMIDKRGEFLQPTLFDTSAGVHR
jgi:hypothetical protein